jgi:Mrp family chromosome partitioning ATPase/predicted Fe-Mo cluster-binding NifX family protein
MTSENVCQTCDDSACSSKDRRADERDDEFAERQALHARMCRIKHKILVVSGKGGVGKSTVAVNLAVALALAGKQVGLLDADIHGPSVPKLLRLEECPMASDGNTLNPYMVTYGVGALKVMSIGFFLRGSQDAVIWRGPRKYGVTKRFLRDVEWGDLDYLIVDCPPGTGDEPLAVAQLIGKVEGAVMVTTPQEVAIQDVRRCVGFCRELAIPVLGVVENMSGLVCPRCGEVVNVFGTGGGEAMAAEMDVPYLGSIPIEPDVVVSGDRGTPIVQAKPDSSTSRAFGRLVRRMLEPELSTKVMTAVPSGGPLKIAIPIADGRLASHFGHCQQFAVFDCNSEHRTIERRQDLTPPPHEPGTFPKWLHEQGATIIIAGGMGSRAQSLFDQHGIKVVVGAASVDPETIVTSFLQGQLQTGANECDH